MPSAPLPIVVAPVKKSNYFKALLQEKSSHLAERKSLAGTLSSNQKDTTKRKTLLGIYNFTPLTTKSSYAELDNDVKNAISHRSKALDKLKDFLKDRA